MIGVVRSFEADVRSDRRSVVASCGLRFDQPTHASQVVGDCDHRGEEVGLLYSPVPRLPAATHRLLPSKYRFDSSPDDRADSVAGMSRRSRVDARASVRSDALGDVRGDAEIATAIDEALGVVALVGPYRDVSANGNRAHQKVEGGLGFGDSDRRSHREIDDEAVSILHQHVFAEDELRLLAEPLPQKLGVGVCGRRVRFVVPGLAFEIGPTVAVSSVVVSFLLGRKDFIDAQA